MCMMFHAVWTFPAAHQLQLIHVPKAPLGEARATESDARQLT